MLVSIIFSLYQEVTQWCVKILVNNNSITIDAQTLDRCRLPGYRVARGPYARVEKCPGKTNDRVERCPGGQMSGWHLSPRASFLDVWSSAKLWFKLKCHMSWRHVSWCYIFCFKCPLCCVSWVWPSSQDICCKSMFQKKHADLVDCERLSFY